MDSGLLHERKLNRLKGYDYSQNGFYFITVCVHQRLQVLGNIIKGKMELNRFGKIVWNCWNDLPNHYANCVLHAFVVMPNHIHGIIEIDNDRIIGNGQNVGNGLRPFPTEKRPFPTVNATIHGLSEMVRALKSFSSRKINEISDFKFKWQKSFYDHIIRDEQSFNRITEYIRNNPIKWNDDLLNE